MARLWRLGAILSRDWRCRTTVIIVDDHAVVRKGIRAFIENCDDIEIVGEAGSGKEAVQLCTEHAPDVVLMDLMMEDIDGIEATRLVKKISPRTNIIVLTSFHNDKHVFPAMKAGAQSYLLKDIGPAELAEAIRRAARGEATLHPRVAVQVIDSLNANKRDYASISELTEREIEVLQLISDGMSNADIAGKLCISEKTVKSHVSNILSKLNLTDRTQAAVYAWRQGLKKD